MEYELFSELQDIEEVSKQITAYISKNKLSVDFNGERHILASGWSYAGHLFGLTAVPAAPVKEVSNEVVTILYKDKVSNGKKSLMPYCATTLAEQVEQATRKACTHEKSKIHLLYLRLRDSTSINR